MPNGTYGGVRGRKTKVGRKLLRFLLLDCTKMPEVCTNVFYVLYKFRLKFEHILKETC